MIRYGKASFGALEWSMRSVTFGDRFMQTLQVLGVSGFLGTTFSNRGLVVLPESNHRFEVVPMVSLQTLQGALWLVTFGATWI